MRNSRLSEHLRGDLDAEIGACQARLPPHHRAGASATASRRSRPAFDQILETPPRSSGGDPAEDQGRGLSLRGLHRGRRCRRAAPARAPAHHDQDARTRSSSTSPAPIRKPRARSTGRSTTRRAATSANGWRRCCARSPPRRSAPPKSTPTKACSTSSRSFPPQGHADHAASSAGPTGMRFFLMLRSLGVFAACLSKATGGSMPADHETIRIWGLAGGTTQDDFFLFREVLGGGGPGGRGPTAPTSSTSCRTRGTCRRSSPRRAIRSWSSSSALKQDSGGAGYRRGGSATTSASARSDDCAPDLQCRPLDPRLLRRQRRQGGLNPTRSR